MSECQASFHGVLLTQVTCGLRYSDAIQNGCSVICNKKRLTKWTMSSHILVDGKHKNRDKWDKLHSYNFPRFDSKLCRNCSRVFERGSCEYLCWEVSSSCYSIPNRLQSSYFTIDREGDVIIETSDWVTKHARFIYHECHSNCWLTRLFPFPREVAREEVYFELLRSKFINISQQ